MLMGMIRLKKPDRRISEIKRGFTLIELLVVISIIGILVGFGTVAFDNALEKGRDTKRKNDLTAVKTALELYFEDNHRYPDPAGGGSSSDSKTYADWIPQLVQGGYIEQLPIDPTQAGIIGNLANLPKQFLKKEKAESARGQVASAADLPTLAFGTFIGTGALGFESNLDPIKYNRPFAAGYMLRQQWSKIETSDNVYNWNYLDNKLTELKGAGKKGLLRIYAGSSSPDWLRTQLNVKTVCWFKYIKPGGAPEGSTWNCFPWMMDATYRNKEKEFLEALYYHYTVQRADLGAAISFISVPAPNIVNTEEFVAVQNPNNTNYFRKNTAGLPIGIYCTKDAKFSYCPPELPQVDPVTQDLDPTQPGTLPSSSFNAEGYTQSSYYQTMRDWIADAYSAIPTWYLAVMHAKHGPSPLSLVQNNYGAIISGNMLDRAMMGFTWAMPMDDLVANWPTNLKPIYDDVKANFYLAHDGMTGWQYDPLDTDNNIEEHEAWCTLAAPISGKWGEGGGGRWAEDSSIAQVYADPYCGLAPTPTPTPTLAPTPSVPPKPALISPTDGEINVSTSPTLTWNPSAGADTYRVHVSLLENFTPTIINQGGLTTTSFEVGSVLPGGLLPNTTYWWRVRATNAAGDSLWSKRSFTTGDVLPTPTSTPAPTSTPVPTPEISPTPGPTPSEGISNYLYEIFDNGQSFVLWAKLENESDQEISGHSGATCNESPPEGYNYCLKN
ncbi:MAG: fibronectin type III, nonfunctional [Microgenomates group bacterium GW2011_GWC1_40_35]|nr:MAG: fibronectin type III, nonfunctional [Microgenomates group bacterium GW2011_GWC1_40_35]KKS00737.1 MAG: fibronectin type III, nonfunctional [Candidatus Curtissbacteria bacterium GW2011_GWC2_41_21]OGE12299.1 MAG: hypothetical protein A2305_05740 [Candidatus Curtissbacteria bacterium RIFOXYB2_FULL_41_10]